MSKLKRGKSPEHSLLLKNLLSTVAKHRLFPSSVLANNTTLNTHNNTSNTAVMHDDIYKDRINHLYDHDEDTVNYGSARPTNNYQQRMCPQPISASYQSNIRRNYTAHNRQFCGRCRACNMSNHHAFSCHFLQKIQQCLAYMESNNLTPSDNRRGMRNNTNYS